MDDCRDLSRDSPVCMRLWCPSSYTPLHTKLSDYPAMRSLVMHVHDLNSPRTCHASSSQYIHCIICSIGKCSLAYDVGYLMYHSTLLTDLVQTVPSSSFLPEVEGICIKRHPSPSTDIYRSQVQHPAVSMDISYSISKSSPATCSSTHQAWGYPNQYW